MELSEATTDPPAHKQASLRARVRGRAIGTGRGGGESDQVALGARHGGIARVYVSREYSLCCEY